MPGGKEGCRANRQRCPSDTRTIATGDIWNHRDTDLRTRPRRPPAQRSWLSLTWCWCACGRIYLRVVDASAAADPLTACLVPAGRLTRGGTEPAGLVPAQQCLSLQGPKSVSGTSWCPGLLLVPGGHMQNLLCTLVSRGASDLLRTKRPFFRSTKFPSQASSTAT